MNNIVLLLQTFSGRLTDNGMHAINQITPEILLLMCVGGIAFILIFKAIFKSKK